MWLPAVSQHTSYHKDGGEGASKNVEPGSLIQLDLICVSNQRSPASRESLQKPRLVTQILSNRACPAYQSLPLRSFRFHQKQRRSLSLWVVSAGARQDVYESTWRRREWGPVDPWGSTLVEPPPLEGTIRAHSSLGKPQGVEGQERGWMKSGCGCNKSIAGTNSKMTCRNRERFLLSAPRSESQGAEEKGKNIYHVPILQQTFCSHFQVTSFKLRRNRSRLFHPLIP